MSHKVWAQRFSFNLSREVGWRLAVGFTFGLFLGAVTHESPGAAGSQFMTPPAQDQNRNAAQRKLEEGEALREQGTAESLRLALKKFEEALLLCRSIADRQGEAVMLVVLQVVTATLVSITMALALAHALEFPGKMRLSETEYRTVQTIYYPGFTIGGISEPLAALALLMLLFMTQTGTAAFWLMLMAFIALGLMHLIFWLMTQPVNKLWLASEKLSPASESAGNFCNLQGIWPIEASERTARTGGYGKIPYATDQGIRRS